MKTLSKGKKVWLIAGGGVLLLALAIFIAIGSTPVLNYAAGIARQQLAAMDLDLEIGELSGNPFRALALKRVRLSKDNVVLISLPQTNLSINFWALIRGNIVVEDLVLHKPVININELVLNLAESNPDSQATPPVREGGSLPLRIAGFTIDQAAVNFDLPGYHAYSLHQLALNGTFAMDADQYTIELERAHALWQINDQTALAASGSLRLAGDSLNLSQFKLAVGDNLLNADGVLDWGPRPAADMQLQARFSHAFLPGGSLEVAAPARPLNIDLKLDSAGQNWRTVLTLEQEPARLSLSGTISPQNWLVNLSGQAQEFYPHKLYPALPDALHGINLNGDISVQLSPTSLNLALASINLDDTNFAQMQAELHWGDHLLEISQLEIKQPEGSLSLNAHLPLPFLSAPSEMKLQLHNFAVPGQPLIAAGIPQALRTCTFNGQASLRGNMQKGEFSLLLDKIPAKDNPQAAHLSLAGNWQDHTLKLTRGELQAPWASATLAGNADREKIDLDLEFRLLDISPISGFVPQTAYLPTQGSLAGRIKASGKPDAPRLDYEMRGQNLKGQDMALNGIELKGSLLLEKNLTMHSELNVNLLTVAGLSFNSLLLNARLNEGAGNINLQALSANGWKANLDLAPLAPDLTSWRMHNINFSGPQNARWQQQGQARLDMPDNGIQLQNLRLISDGQSFDANFSLLAGIVRGEININQAELGAIIGGLPVSPRLNLQARLGGGSDNPEITFSSQIQASLNQEIISLNLGGNYKNQQAVLSGQLLAGGQSLFNLNGEARIPLDGNIEIIQLNARANKLSLAMLQPFLPAATNLRGTLDMDISLAGSWPRLNPRGYIKLDNGGFGVHAISMNFRRFNMLLECHEQGLSISQFELRTGPGEVRAQGHIDWPWYEQAALDVSLNAQNLLIKLPPWGNLSMDADLSLGGNFETPVLTGNIVHNSANVQIFRTSHSDLDEVVSLNSEQEPPPLSFNEPEDFNIEVPAFFDSWEIMVNIAMSPRFRVNFPQGWFQVSGKMGINKEPYQDPVYSGRYTIDGGVIVIFGTRVESLSGFVAFTDPASFFPDLDVRATVRRGFTNIVARIHGSAANPILSFVSDPPMSEADILSMLAFGKPIQQLSQDQGSSLSSQAMALAVIGERGRQELQNIMGSTITPDVITMHDGVQSGSSIEAGKYLTRNLYLRYRQGTDQTDSRSLGLEWQLTPRISLQGELGTERDSGVDIFFHFVSCKTEEQTDSASAQPQK